MGKKTGNLASLHPGQQGWISDIHAEEDIGQRLRDMGLVEGSRIECAYRSPFGDPTAYFVKGTLIAIRNRDAENIDIESESPLFGGSGREWGSVMFRQK